MMHFTPQTPIALPGMVNAHSHAFQRLLRGRVQRRLPHRTDSFWTWRETMYALANQLDPSALEASARLTYAECLEAGYTAVGEFHYLHHPVGTDDDGLAAAEAMIRGARQTGIRLCLLAAAYERGGFGEALTERQGCFDTKSPEALLSLVDKLLAIVAREGEGRIAIGLAIHSVRAVPPAQMSLLAAGARARGLPIHVHASEQPKEVQDCLAATGHRPIGLLAEAGVLGPDCSVVHATWYDDADLDRLEESGSGVIICPSTEGDLGDGFPRLAAMHARGIRLSIGSDSHAVIDPFAELRQLETNGRVASGSRCVLADSDGELRGPLEAIGSRHGRRALGLPETGHGDGLVLRAEARFFAEVPDGDRALAALLGGHAGLVDRVEVGGELLVEGGRHLHL